MQPRNGERFRRERRQPLSELEAEGRPSPMSRQCRLHRRTEIQGYRYVDVAEMLNGRRNSDHRADAGILLRRGAAKASGADGEAWLQAECKA